ncbi:MAG: hypothetical protein Unbinned4409contig1001_53 [Prokaryotic dsDNA virus sp.]|nr:MAG: hypothetical protein Unbinned4409contig1001_53 [Prokaryotic dsDNA virus sp.]|tara:strand:+ start:2185 stop:2652 length:468 start_codon:yes stop_codon:yes gene_type:complete
MGYIDERTQSDFQELENEINTLLADHYDDAKYNMRDIGDNKERYKDQTGQYLFTLWVIDKYHRLDRSKMGAIGEWFNRDRSTPNHWRDKANVEMRRNKEFRDLYDNLTYLGTKYATEGYLKAHGIKIRFIERQMERLSARRDKLLKDVKRSEPTL